VFDCLCARGEELGARPLADRRAVLERAVRPSPALRLARRVDANGLEAFARARARGLEGIVAKDTAAPYQAGARSRHWLKVKIRAEDEFVIGGYTAPAGARAHFGALLIGAWDGDRLRYAGKVGTGFDGRMLADLMARFRPLVRDTPPFADAPRERGVTWLEPRLVAQIGFTEWTGDGRLRHPTFLGPRDDKDARAVTWPAARVAPPARSSR
jgi:bifunctional non-homologous end joining protein LigD